MPAQSPTLSPTLSAMVAGLRGSSSGMPASTLPTRDRKSTRLNSSHVASSYAVFCLKKKKETRADSAARPRTDQPRQHPAPTTAVRHRLHSHRARPAVFFFFNDTATTEIYTLSLHDALPI